MLFNVGDWVEKAPFGTGQIIDDRGTFFIVQFISSGEKKLAKDYVTSPGTPPHPNFQFSQSKLKHRVGKSNAGRSFDPAFSFEHLCDRFLSTYPLGFEDPGFDREERQYKDAAVEKLELALGRKEMHRLMGAEQHGEIAKRAKQIASGEMNLIFPQELMSFNDALKSSVGQLEFSSALFDVLYGSDPEENRFERYVDVLGKLGCLKWTVATFFQFIATKGEAMFMKPSVAKLFSSAVGVDLNYSTIPRWLTYQKLNETASVVRERLLASGLKPRHGIDLQSFMYVAWHETK
jgi:hypothetical protein